ncbi:uncharacterized protein BDR25DRAFT_324849 [Lindgomyces ingoldianus]|uniref:Uncharacterized protein n=1 Tax=Lindgomyces ingoldianus TaxID=673940 RepID=A0ACB6QYR5_9PLEO|nr:uncharacterized protein BDR25DRAFT_324849 [Lindgomyces ingoldianus]KAF2471670.1 hypothetical protein BDR25DRAFT_324849 [Lindgomyces ingoldianus]
MEILVVLAFLSLSIHGVWAHGTFAHFVVNGTIAPEWKYVRDVAGAPDYENLTNIPQYAKRVPFFDIYSPNMVCGRSAERAAANTETATVIAGSEVGFKLAEIIKQPTQDLIFHDGPAQAFMSRAPNDDLEHYDGKGDWFKVGYIGPKSDTAWKLKGKNGWNFSIPKTTPPGKYLLRIEQFQPYRLFNTSQWYVNCAHVKVVGPGGGTPTRFVKFPGAYNISDPGTTPANFN